MNPCHFISALILFAAAALPAGAASGREMITAEQVAAAMTGSGIEISSAQVTMLTDVVATTIAPALKVESMERWGDHRMRVRMDCARREECLPFFVAIRWSETDVAQPVVPAPHGIDREGGSDRLAPAMPRVEAESGSLGLRAGSPATLLLEGDHIHIQIAVVCLENGAPGATIRVASKDHKQTYTARVGDGAVLRGRL